MGHKDYKDLENVHLMPKSYFDIDRIKLRHLSEMAKAQKAISEFESVFERKPIMLKIATNEQTPKVPEIEDIDQWIKDNQAIINEFLKRSRKTGNAVGLAANQLEDINGDRFMYRMFCSKAEGEGDGEWKVFINPRIVAKHGDPQSRVEGCLTWPNKKVIADRYLRIDVEYWTQEGEKKTAELSGWEAQVWQHEQDHLDGVQEELVAPDHLTVRSEKIGRNEPCPCGKEVNGKPVNYKKCCGKK